MVPWPGLDPYIQTVELTQSGIRLFYYHVQKRDSPAILMLHGLGDDADTWRHLVEPLSAYARLVVPDLPGFGRSEKPDIDYTIPFLCDTAIELLDTLDIEKAIVIGNSLGAIIAQKMALDHPDRIASLVLVDGMLFASDQRLSPHNLQMLTPGLGEWTYNQLRKNPQDAYDTLIPYYFDLDALPAEERDFLFQRVNQRVWDDRQRDAYFSVLRSMASYVVKAQSGLAEKLSKSKVPTLILWGEEDVLFSIKNARRLVEIQPSAMLVTFPEAGHSCHQEKPHELLQAILQDERLGIIG